MEVRFQSDQVILCYEFFLFGYWFKIKENME
jgi:hypothetical protein